MVTASASSRASPSATTQRTMGKEKTAASRISHSVCTENASDITPGMPSNHSTSPRHQP